MRTPPATATSACTWCSRPSVKRPGKCEETATRKRPFRGRFSFGFLWSRKAGERYAKHTFPMTYIQRLREYDNPQSTAYAVDSSFAKGVFWAVRFPAPSECEKTLEFTTPKRPLFERGWHALACRGIAVFQWRKRRRREFPMAAVSAVAKHSLSRFRRQLVSKRSFLDCAPFFF